MLNQFTYNVLESCLTFIAPQFASVVNPLTAAITGALALVYFVTYLRPV